MRIWWKPLLIFLFALVLTCCARKPQPCDCGPEAPAEVKRVEARLEKRPFYNKMNKPVDGVFEWFLHYDGKDVRVKVCSGKLPEEALESLLKKRFIACILEEDGPLDNDCQLNLEEIQTRWGNYVSLLKVCEL
jgi:hypothetical protein